MTQYKRSGVRSSKKKERRGRSAACFRASLAVDGRPSPLVNTRIIPFCRLALYDANHVGPTGHFHEVTNGMTRCAWLRNLIGTWLVASGCGAAEPSLIPWPANVTTGEGAFVVSRETPICALGMADSVARQFQAVVKSVEGLDLAARGCDGAVIALLLSPTATVPDTEGYTLDVSPTGVRIQARAAPGLYYGAMTAAQLLSSSARRITSVRLQGMHIEDFPRFKWRGLMLDPARHFLPAADIKLIIDQMGQHKLNVLHLHLTDDQGWRLQIKRYPELTRIGAWRKPPSNGGPGGDEGLYGGFYTQEEIRDLVAYAAARYITVVPEIDVPGHAQAVVAAHPQL